MCEKRFDIIGISDSSQFHFPQEILAVIKNGRVFSGGKRHYTLVKGLLPEDAIWIYITVPISGVFKEYSKFSEIIVFASGDPLFFGFATTIIREYPSAQIKIFPSCNSLQLLAHRLLMPYANMINVSLTGRPWSELDVPLLENRECIGILTDKHKTPDAIAKYLLEYGYDNYRMAVGEQLGNEAENINCLSLKEAAEKEFKAPNCLILTMVKPRQRFFGIPENHFHHLAQRENMITKMPVRLLSLSMLDLFAKKVFWDIGFCTGSVSIEAKLNFPRLNVIAFEIREESEKILSDNMRKFGVPGIRAVIGDFLKTDLNQIPRPDAVFIGGHGGKLYQIVERVSSLINTDGVIVFNSVIPDNCRIFRESVEKCGMQIVDSHTLILDNHNPITIMKAL